MGLFGKKKKEFVTMSLEDYRNSPAMVCTPNRNCQLTGQYLGEASVGGYLEVDQPASTERGADLWHEQNRVEVPDMGRVQVHTGHRGAAGNQQELDRWHHLNADEWARVDAPEHSRINR